MSRRDTKIHMDADELKDFMKRHNFDKESLSEMLGVTPLCVNHWVIRRRAISKTTARIIRFLDKYPQTMSFFSSID
jgi:plasmid maintenance system antidote protein VapI